MYFIRSKLGDESRITNRNNSIGHELNQDEILKLEEVQWARYMLEAIHTCWFYVLTI